MSFGVDFSSIRTVNVHKEQFEAIDKKANTVMITCIEDGRCVAFNRADNEKDKIDRLNNNNQLNVNTEIMKRPDRLIGRLRSGCELSIQDEFELYWYIKCLEEKLKENKNFE